MATRIIVVDYDPPEGVTDLDLAMEVDFTLRRSINEKGCTVYTLADFLADHAEGRITDTDYDIEVPA